MEMIKNNTFVTLEKQAVVMTLTVFASFLGYENKQDIRLNIKKIKG